MTVTIIHHTAALIVGAGLIGTGILAPAAAAIILRGKKNNAIPQPPARCKVEPLAWIAGVR